MDRRAFVTGLGAVLAAPLAVEAQQARSIAVVGVLHDRPAGPSTIIRTLQEELRGLGYGGATISLTSPETSFNERLT